MYNHHTTVAAPATAPGGAIALIRVSGPRAIATVQDVFSGTLENEPGNTVHFGTIRDDERIIDEVLVTLFRAPRSFTGEDMVEISCHGSSYIIREILALLIRHGAEHASAGEFTRRAFLNGKFDLSQAEAIADLIASESAASHRVALRQMRGGYAAELAEMREKLLHITALLELELDFSEEDVEFADRSELKGLLEQIKAHTDSLAQSFRTGNAIKNGIPVAIVGEPNAGKSTLLNKLLGEERAIVSDIAGTTRDFIEEKTVIGGLQFRFIDTAGLRQTSDTIEKLGIQRTRENIAQAEIVLVLIPESKTIERIREQLAELGLDQQKVVLLFNKSDLWDPAPLASEMAGRYHTVSLSAKHGDGVDHLKKTLISFYDTAELDDHVVVNNIRHYEALVQASRALETSLLLLDTQSTSELISEEVREVIAQLGTITGEITSNDILGHIFSKFCIGK